MAFKRTFALVASIMLSATLYGQVNNFSVTSEGKVYWQRVYPTDLSHEELLDIIVNDGNFVDVNDGEVITFRLIRGKVDFKQLGFSRGSLPLYATASDITCFVTIQIKDGRYRITADNILTVENRTDGMFKEGDENPIETWAVKKGEISNAFSKIPSQLYNGYFSNLFLFQKKSYIDDEW